MNSKTNDIAQRRMKEQGIGGGAGFADPAAVVEWMGCMQAQDFAMAKWAIGCRMGEATATTGEAIARKGDATTGAGGKGAGAAALTTREGIETRWDGEATDQLVEAHFNAGRFLRTHVLRPTWHFVAPRDIRWMLALTAPRIRSFAQSHHRQLAIDAPMLKKSKEVIGKALEGGAMDRKELQEALAAKKIRTDEARLGFLLLDAELDGLICSGGKRGKQFLYALMEEIVPSYDLLEGEEALGELALRYFRSHGPATVEDFVGWSGLTLTAGRKGIAQNGKGLFMETIDGREFWMGDFFDGGEPGTGKVAATGVRDGGGKMAAAAVHLLPGFDEYFIGYKDRTDLVDGRYAKMVMTSNGIFNPMLVYKGQVVGKWKREEKKDRVVIALTVFDPAVKIPKGSLDEAVKRYRAFCGKEIELL